MEEKQKCPDCPYLPPLKSIKRHLRRYHGYGVGSKEYIHKQAIAETVIVPVEMKKKTVKPQVSQISF